MIHNGGKWMKKLNLLLGLIFFITLLYSPTTMAKPKEAAQVSLYVDGQSVVYKKITNQGRTENMISLRAAASALHLNLTWSASSKEWSLSSAAHTIKVKLNSTTAYVDNQKKTLKMAPMLDNRTLYIPIRFIVESSGGTLQYYKGNDMALIWVLSSEQEALNSALLSDNVKQLKLLLKDWRALTIPTGVDGMLPYNFATDSVAETKVLLDAGFPINYQEFEYAQIGIANHGYTLLHDAVSHGQLEVVQYLLENGADPNLLTKTGFADALGLAKWGKSSASEGFFDYKNKDRAAMVQKFDAIIALLEKHIKMKVYFKDENQNILLTSADIMPGSIEVVGTPWFDGEIHYGVYFMFKDADKWEQITTDLSGQTLSIYLNDILISSPRIQGTIQGGGAGFSGGFTEEEIRDIAHLFELAVASAGKSGN